MNRDRTVGEFLSMLKIRRDKLDDTIRAVETLLTPEVVEPVMTGASYFMKSVLGLPRTPKPKKAKKYDAVAHLDSIHAIAAKILKGSKEGLTTFELLKRMKSRGKSVGGKNPVATLHSIMYRRNLMFSRVKDRWVVNA